MLHCEFCAVWLSLRRCRQKELCSLISHIEQVPATLSCCLASFPGLINNLQLPREFVPGNTRDNKLLREYISQDREEFREQVTARESIAPLLLDVQM